jgi:hypothetical protein
MGIDAATPASCRNDRRETDDLTFGKFMECSCKEFERGERTGMMLGMLQAAMGRDPETVRVLRNFERRFNSAELWKALSGPNHVKQSARNDHRGSLWIIVDRCIFGQVPPAQGRETARKGPHQLGITLTHFDSTAFEKTAPDEGRRKKLRPGLTNELADRS